MCPHVGVGLFFGAAVVCDPSLYVCTSVIYVLNLNLVSQRAIHGVAYYSLLVSTRLFSFSTFPSCVVTCVAVGLQLLRPWRLARFARRRSRA